MPLIDVVPAAVPLLFHSSKPLPSLAVKYRMPLKPFRLAGSELYCLSGDVRISLTGTVPANVPLLFHSSRPFTPFLAEKNSVPLTLVRLAGFEPDVPVKISLTRAVPAAVPSLLHSSRPWSPSALPSVAANISLPPRLAKSAGSEPAAPELFKLMSLTRAVVPVMLRDHSSRPLTPLSADKNSVLPTAKRLAGSESAAP